MSAYGTNPSVLTLSTVIPKILLATIILTSEYSFKGAPWGLEQPPDLTGFPLHVVKTANATTGHYGEMSGAQPWVIL